MSQFKVQLFDGFVTVEKIEQPPIVVTKIGINRYKVVLTATGQVFVVGSLSERGLGFSEISAAISAAGAVTERGIGSANISSAVTLLGDVTESGIGSSRIYSGSELAGVIAEAGIGLSEISALFNRSGLVTESGTGAANVTALFNRSGLVTESGIGFSEVTEEIVTSFLLDIYPGAAVAYGAIKLSAATNDSVRALRTSDLAEQNIGFDGSAIDVTQMNTFANGGQIRMPQLLAQSGASYTVNLTQSTVARQADLSNASGAAYDHIKITGKVNESYWQPENLTTPPSMTGDYVIAIAMRNEQLSSNQRPTFYCKTDNSNCFVFQVRNRTSDCVFEYQMDTGAATQVDGGFTFTTAENALWYSIVIVRISGVLSLYFNGVQKTIITSGLNVTDARGGNGFGINVRPVNFGQQIRQFDFKSLVMYNGADLSSFNINGFMTAFNTANNVGT